MVGGLGGGHGPDEGAFGAFVRGAALAGLHHFADDVEDFGRRVIHGFFLGGNDAGGSQAEC